jgi:hypothetical protein
VNFTYLNKLEKEKKRITYNKKTIKYTWYEYIKEKGFVTYIYITKNWYKTILIIKSNYILKENNFNRIGKNYKRKYFIIQKKYELHFIQIKPGFLCIDNIKYELNIKELISIEIYSSSYKFNTIKTNIALRANIAHLLDAMILRKIIDYNDNISNVHDCIICDYKTINNINKSLQKVFKRNKKNIWI